RALRAAPLAWMLTMPVHAQVPVQNESLVSSQPDIIDLEFSQDRAQFLWVDAVGRVWIGNIDRNTGLFSPANGKGTLVSADGMSIAKTMVIPTNGAEWVSTATGEAVVFSTFLPGAAKTKDNARIALATETGPGQWQTTVLSPEATRYAPYASHDSGDALPRLSYVDGAGTHYWRNLFDAGSEALVPQANPTQRSVRFVQGARAMIYAAPVNGVQQVLHYNLDTQQLEQLTFDEGDKDIRTVPWMWQAPEFGGEYLFFTVVNYSELRVYRKLLAPGAQQPAWTVIYTAKFPNRLTVMSPEPFTYQGKSYIYLVTSKAPDTYASVVWLSNIDADNAFVRKLTPDSPVRQRSDPEVFFTQQGPYLYFNRADQSVLPAKQEGVYRTFTGLPAPGN
ncbi:MAG TPA: hypothetical protein VLJ19_15725, partial [Variovorax sp.]|nr:hypothetical protein [Variovorax sp.]